MGKKPGPTRYTLDLATGKVIQVVNSPTNGSGPTVPGMGSSGGAAGVPSPDGKLNVIVSGKDLVFVDVKTGKILSKITLDGAVKDAGQSFSPDGKLLHVRGTAGQVWAVDVATGKLLKKSVEGKDKPTVADEYDYARAVVEVARHRLARLKALNQALSQAEVDAAAADVAKAEKQLQATAERAQSTLKAAEAQRTVAEAEYKRLQQLFAQGLASRRTWTPRGPG